MGPPKMFRMLSWDDFENKIGVLELKTNWGLEAPIPVAVDEQTEPPAAE